MEGKSQQDHTAHAVADSPQDVDRRQRGTTALRRIDELQSHDLIVRIEDKDDKRRTIIRLTDAGLKAVEKFFEACLERRQA